MAEQNEGGSVGNVIAVCRLSLVVVSEAAPYSGVQASHCDDFPCGAQALGLRASVMEHAGSRLRPVPWRAQAPLVVRTGFDA